MSVGIVFKALAAILLVIAGLLAWIGYADFASGERPAAIYILTFIGPVIMAIAMLILSNTIGRPKDR